MKSFAAPGRRCFTPRACLQAETLEWNDLIVKAHLHAG
jgi:hypothetical protein